MLTVLLFLFTCIFILLCIYTQTPRGHKLPPAYSVELPIIGQAYLILGTPSGLWSTLCKVALACVDNGGIMYCKIFNQIHYLITDPDDAHTAANACLKKHYIYDYMKSLLGNGLFTGPVDIWKHRRRVLLPDFSLPVVQGFMDAFNSQSKKMVRELEQYLGKGQFSTEEIFTKTFFETICLTGLGIDVIEDFEFVQNYMKSIDLYKSIAMMRFQKPWLMSDFFFKLLGYKKRETELLNELSKLFNVLLHKKKLILKDIENYNEVPAKEFKGKPLLNHLLELSSNNIINEHSIAEEVNTAILGGYESIANMLLITMVFLGEHTEVQQRAFEEVIKVMGEHRDVEKTDIPNLVYIEAVIMETIRFYSTAPALPRHVETDVKLKNYTLRKGTYVVILSTGLHHHHSWGDGAEFRPERWLNPETLPKKSYVGFGIGKRNCIAKTYALHVMKVALVHILRRYRIDATEKNLKIGVNLSIKVDATVALHNRM